MMIFESGLLLGHPVVGLHNELARYTEARRDSRRRTMAAPIRSSFTSDANTSGVRPYTSLTSADSPSLSISSRTYTQTATTIASPNSV